MKARIPPPLIMLGFAALMFFVEWLMPLNLGLADVTAVLSSVVGLVGTGLLIESLYRFIKAKTTVNPIAPEKASQLVVTGVYRLSRNPMYLGMACWLFAYACYLANPITLLLVFGFIKTINTLQIEPEEAALASIFGDAYEDYKASVRRWI